MYLKNLKYAAAGIALLAAGCGNSTVEDAKAPAAEETKPAPVETSVKYTPDLESLSAHNASPDWFRDVKFGIYFHWGPYAVPAYGGEWYPRWMHYEGLESKGNNVDGDSASFYKHHEETYGPLNEFGYHDFIPMFTAENFDPDEWADLFKASGAQFAGPVGEHHDGFAMWDSDVTPWNAADMGPKRDVAGEMADAVRERGMKFIISFHHARNLQRYRGVSLEEELKNPENKKGNLGRAYWHSHFPWFEGQPQTSDDPELRKLYGNIPEDEWLDTMWLAKLEEVIDKYEPDIIWFDAWLDKIPEEHRFKFASYYLNAAEKWGKEVVITHKGEDMPDTFSTIDFEKGRASGLTELPFLTDDTVSLGSWSYTEAMEVKSLNRVMHDFIDIVSKNGQLLLNVSPKADGTIPEDQRAVLLGMGEWLETNGEAIYDTRPWKVFGEGPSRLEKSGHFSKALTYSAKDIRFTQNGSDLYVITLGKPEGTEFSVASLSAENGISVDSVKSVSSLGSEADVTWDVNDAGMTISVPEGLSGDTPAHVWKIELK